MWVCRRKDGFLSKQPRREDVKAKVRGTEGHLIAEEPDGSDAYVYVEGAET